MKTKYLTFGSVLSFFVNIVMSQNDQQLDSLNVNQILEEVVLVDTRIPIKRSQSGKTVIRINEKQIEAFQGRNLAELLSSYGGINLIGSRSITGQNLRFAIRGSTNSQVLIIVDGVRVSDPSRIDNDLDINLLSIGDIDSIEILKGAASTMYGSAAAAGVILVNTKKGSEKNNLNLGITTGTEQQANQSFYTLSYYAPQFNYSRKTGKLNYRTGISLLSTNGMSAVTNGTEVDPFLKYNINAQLGYENKNLSFSFLASKAQIKNEYDSTFPTGEDAAYLGFSFMESLTLKSNYKYAKGSLELQAGHQSANREYRDAYPSAFNSKNSSVELLHRTSLSSSLYSVQGVLFQESSYDGVPVTYQKDIFANLVYLSEGFNTNIGFRLNNHQTYGSHFTYTLNPSYSLVINEVSKLKFFGSIGSAFIAPTLYQLHDGFYGNRDLAPEESQSIELGADWSTVKANMSVVAFRRKEDPKIIYDFATNAYANGPSNIVFQGVEMEYNNSFSEQLSFRMNYTFTELKEGSLARIPKHALNAQLNYTFNTTSVLNGIFNYQGARQGIDASQLRAYSLIDLRYAKSFGKHFSTHLWIINLFDTDYVEIAQFNTLGRNVRLGINYRF